MRSRNLRSLRSSIISLISRPSSLVIKLIKDSLEILIRSYRIFIQVYNLFRKRIIVPIFKSSSITIRGIPQFLVISSIFRLIAINTSDYLHTSTRLARNFNVELFNTSYSILFRISNLYTWVTSSINVYLSSHYRLPNSIQGSIVITINST